MCSSTTLKPQESTTGLPVSPPAEIQVCRSGLYSLGQALFFPFFGRPRVGASRLSSPMSVRMGLAPACSAIGPLEEARKSAHALHLRTQRAPFGKRPRRVTFSFDFAPCRCIHLGFTKPYNCEKFGPRFLLFSVLVIHTHE